MKSNRNVRVIPVGRERDLAICLPVSFTFCFVAFARSFSLRLSISSRGRGRGELNIHMGASESPVRWNWLPQIKICLFKRSYFMF